MDDYLVFQLYAPLASWGGQAVGQERPSDDHPGRSALLGLLAAALGIRREEEAEHRALSNACRFGIRLLAPGLALRDFHTIQVPPVAKKQQHLQTRRDELREPRVGTMLSFRSYRQDAVSVVAVTSNDARFRPAILLDTLFEPVFPLYLGRKACPPALPLNPEVISAPHLRAALDSYCVAPCLAKCCSGPSRYYWEAGMKPGMVHDYQAPRYDQPISRQHWQFAPRDEFVCLGGE
ncbi:type I-E CRISPR-associated protein Cas5/CasD [Thiolapillus sp.]|uniref:type I-E CRISPR-associated protein Cas5/CasD n=1 Tax=Thiolapillus sp. TaxID=2017437 RepID=UPI003AF9A112